MELMEHLEALQFSRLEAQIYLALLGEKPLSAYQLAKKIEISRPSIYNALDHMVQKGMVEVVPNETLLYTAQEPSVLLGKLREKLAYSMKEAARELEAYKESKYEERTVNFCGLDTAVFKVKELLKKAEREIYINTDMDLKDIDEELKALTQKGIRVVVFSFYRIEKGVEGVCYFSHEREKKEDFQPSRLMLAVDKEIALMAEKSTSEAEWKGMVSSHKMFVRMISEHIHNDIYLLKIRDKYGKEIYDDYLYIDTEFEQRAREKE